MTIKVGDRLPEGTLSEFVEVEGNGCSVGPNQFKVEDLTKGKKVVIFGLPGAFTPTCSAKHVPSYLANFDKLTAKGGFDALIAEVLKTVGDKAGLATKPTSVRNIVLAANSGGGSPMRKIVTTKDAEVAKLREVWGFDSMYGGSVDAEAWKKWAQPEKDPKKRAYFHVIRKVYNKEGNRAGPWVGNDELETLAKAAGLLGVNVHLATSSLGHCEMLLPLLEKRLAAAAFFDKI